jgi:2'-5' RNA ligase
MRAFFAIRVAPDVTRSLLVACETLKTHPDYSDAKWTAENNVHLTLRFLGELSTEQVDMARNHADEALRRCVACEIQFNKIQLFPSRKRARVVAVTVEPTSELVDIAERLEAVSRDIGLPAETRRFRPHVTIARLKAAYRKREPVQIAPLDVRFRAQEVELVESKLRPKGAVYRSVQHYRLDRRTH